MHPIGTVCPKKARDRQAYINDYSKRNKKSDIRHSTRWTNCSKRIRNRDNNLCQMCIRKIDMLTDMKQYSYNDVQVHHIVKVKDAEELTFESSNLISLCRYHHELVEMNEKKYIKILKDIVREQEEK